MGKQIKKTAKKELRKGRKNPSDEVFQKLFFFRCCWDPNFLFLSLLQLNSNKLSVQHHSLKQGGVVCCSFFLGGTQHPLLHLLTFNSSALETDQSKIVLLMMFQFGQRNRKLGSQQHVKKKTALKQLIDRVLPSLRKLFFAVSPFVFRMRKRIPIRIMDNVSGHTIFCVTTAARASNQLTKISLYVPIIAILDIWQTTLFYEGESVVYDGFKYVWPVKGYLEKKILLKFCWSWMSDNNYSFYFSAIVHVHVHVRRTPVGNACLWVKRQNHWFSRVKKKVAVRRWNILRNEMLQGQKHL